MNFDKKQIREEFDQKNKDKKKQAGKTQPV